MALSYVAHHTWKDMGQFLKKDPLNRPSGVIHQPCGDNGERKGARTASSLLNYASIPSNAPSRLNQKSTSCDAVPDEKSLVILVNAFDPSVSVCEEN